MSLESPQRMHSSFLDSSVQLIMPDTPPLRFGESSGNVPPIELQSYFVSLLSTALELIPKQISLSMLDFHVKIEGIVVNIYFMNNIRKTHTSHHF